MSALIPNLWTFLGLTLVLGGTAAFVAGRAIARAWLGAGVAIAAMLLLACAIRFLHYALFWEETQLINSALCYVVLCLFALTGFYSGRKNQMALQYPWVG